MPTLLTRREGETLEIAGVTICVAIARDKSATLVVSGYDCDGLLEGPVEVKRRAAAYRAEVTKTRNLTTGEPTE